MERFSRTAEAFRNPAVRAAGSAVRTSAIAVATSSSLVHATIASAPLDVSERCDAVAAEDGAAIEDPLEGRGRAAR